MTITSTHLAELKGVSKRFVKKLDLSAKLAKLFGANISEEVVHAIENVDFTIGKGEVVGLVGESGCGKSTMGRIVAGLIAPTTGERYWRGEPVSTMTSKQARVTQLATQMVFQDHQAALNPRLTVLEIVGEAPVAHRLIRRGERRQYVAEQLRRVGLDPGMARRYPHQFSGGQRARIGIARALAVQPEFLICDEAVAALDVSVQAQVLNLFMELKTRLHLTYLFISHDLGVVRHISDRVLIMYLGRIVEAAPSEELFDTPLHPYTQALLAEIPSLQPRKRSFVPIRGEIPSPLNPPAGCHFHPRCPHVMPRCRQERPPLIAVAPGRSAACFLLS